MTARISVQNQHRVSLVVAVMLLLPPASLLADTDIWLLSYKKPAFYDSSPADHTYACVKDSPYGSFGCYSVMLSGVAGTTSGGSLVNGVNSFSGKWPCYRDCSFIYLRTGVCHQHTNRILYAGGITLPGSVAGYALSVAVYGVTGDNHSATSFASCRAKC